jgi:Kef-type K+ transport system membrane component KefB
VLLGWFGKLVGVMVPSLFLEIPIRDAVSLSLFMSSKGIVEVITFTFFLTNKVIADTTALQMEASSADTSQFCIFYLHSLRGP